MNIEKTPQQVKEEQKKIFSLFYLPENTSIKDVLADFHEAIKHPSKTALFCFRAIEIIRTQYYDDKESSASWQKLRQDLGYKQDDFKEIMVFAVPNRHGTVPKITSDQRERIMNFTRGVIDRFIEKRLALLPSENVKWL